MLQPLIELKQLKFSNRYFEYSSVPVISNLLASLFRSSGLSRKIHDTKWNTSLAGSVSMQQASIEFQNKILVDQDR